MKNFVVVALIACFAVTASAENLVYHEIKTDLPGHIVPWYSPDPGTAYDHCVMLVWNFWKNMQPCPNGVKYYLQHQVWKPRHDGRGLGGDQLSMALSSWALLYAYCGEKAVVDDMVLMADYCLAHGLSAPDCAWPNMPYPYNTDVHSGVYDGDMVAGKGVLQPDKAAAFGAELVSLYKITGSKKYLQAAVAIADTLVAKVAAGDADNSPWPFRVNAKTGQAVPVRDCSGKYTANWTGAIRLLDSLSAMNQGQAAKYATARSTAIAWLKSYPLKTNKWGPFFEDVKRDSNTEINADTLAWFILERPDLWGPTWQTDARAILDYTAATFGNNRWVKYGVKAINEQTAYMMPGNSHSSRHASVELLYAEKTGDASRKPQAVRLLNWATYMVDADGKNRYPGDDIWLTDGYGDYVRHYLRAMAAAPELSPKDKNRLLRTSSVVKTISYAKTGITYSTFDKSSRELLRVAFAPRGVKAGAAELPRLDSASELDKREGYTFGLKGDAPGVLRIRHDNSGDVTIAGDGAGKQGR